MRNSHKENVEVDENKITDFIKINLTPKTKYLDIYSIFKWYIFI